MGSPTVSVVMSVYNGEVYLSEAIASILNQTSRDFEFVIIDDGSTDRTAQILASYARRDTRVRVIHQENKGRAESLNIGMGLAKGKYIARMDADDIALPTRLEAQVEFMEKHPAVGLLGGVYERMSSEGVALGVVQPPLEDAEIRAVLVTDNPMCHPAILMRKEIAIAAGGYRKAFLDADDYDLWLRMSERTQLANLDHCVLRYRIHLKQVSITNKRHQVLCVLAARAAAQSRRQGRPDPVAGVDKITPELVKALGVTSLEFEELLLRTYKSWLEMLEPSDPEVVLEIITGFLRFARSGCIDPRERADLWLKAAAIHYRKGRYLGAMLAAGRGILIRPMVAARPVKRVFVRLGRNLRS